MIKGITIRCFLVGVLFCSLFNVKGQEKEVGADTMRNHHELGMVAEFPTGIKPVYRFWAYPFGLQFGGLRYEAYGMVRSKWELSSFYRVMEGKRTHFSLYQGNYLDYRRIKAGSRTLSRNEHYELFHSLGFGMEMVFWGHLNITLRGAYGIRHFDRDDRVFYLHPSLGLGFYYRF